MITFTTILGFKEMDGLENFPFYQPFLIEYGSLSFSQEIARGGSIVLVKVQNLSAQPGNKKLFSDLTFCLNEGQLLRVLGANGSGKSSLLKIMVGLMPAVSGEIIWYGTEKPRTIIFPDYEYFNHIFYLGHKIGVQGRLTVFENLKFYLSFRGGYQRGYGGYPGDGFEAIHQALAYWELEQVSSLFSEKLSAGQCQRLALARLSLVYAKLWILDEPCNALDAKGIQLFEQRLNAHLDSGGSAIIVSHLSLNWTGSLSLEL